MTVRIIFVLTLLLLLSGLAPAETLELVTLNVEFREYWQKSRNMDLEERLEVWIDIIVYPHNEMFSSFSRGKGDLEGDYRKSALGWLEKIEKIGPRMISEFERLSSETPLLLKRFREHYPDLGDNMRVVILPSMRFDGKPVYSLEKPTLFIGLDQILLREQEQNFPTLMTHELFHMYHIQCQRMDPSEMPYSPTWRLWMEGLAVFATAKLYPGGDHFLDNGTLAKVDHEELKRMAKLFLDDLERSAESQEVDGVMNRWFSAGIASENIPERAGYLLGYHVVCDASRTRKLRDLVSDTPEQAHRQALGSLQRLVREKEAGLVSN